MSDNEICCKINIIEFNGETFNYILTSYIHLLESLFTLTLAFLIDIEHLIIFKN